MGNVSEGKSDDLPQDMIRSAGHLALQVRYAHFRCVWKAANCLRLPIAFIGRYAVHRCRSDTVAVRFVPEEEEISSLLGLAWLREPEQPSSNFHAVHLRHSDVEDGKLRDALVDGPKRFEPIPNSSDYPE
jgi:hypothetical protein